jgi:peptidoglycan/LPS O-acetylase OafA/YrhL
MEKRIYFRNLSALRFFAAFAVILHHVEQYKSWAGLPSEWANVTIDALGHKAVSFFFVLSGFLITYLLLEEHHKTSAISIRDFYIRRVLRIWPVYYVVVIICLFVLPNIIDLSFLDVAPVGEKFGIKLALLMLILPNLLRAFAPHTVGGNQLWSIGVEEQFYLIWPGLVRLFIRNLPLFLVCFIVLKALITVAIQMSLSPGERGAVMGAFHHVWVLFKVEQMAIGAIGAWIVFANRSGWLRVLYNPLTFATAIVCMILVFVLPLHHWLFNFAEGVIFIVIVLNLSCNPKVTVSFETPLLVRLGNVSYGIYMYHTLCITLCLYMLRTLSIDKGDPVIFNLLLYSGSVLLTLSVALFSYEYLEKFFLGMKEKFMIVKSGKEDVTAQQMENALSKEN